MSSALNGVASQLAAELANAVHLPGSPPYCASLDRVFFPDASRRRPPCVVHPRSPRDVARTMTIAAENAARVTVRGGGLSSNCVADDAVMVDLSTYMADAQAGEDTVGMGGGATVGAALKALAPSGRVIPVGIVGLAGLGLVTRGGVGCLTRSVGLTLDHLVAVELVLPSGDVVHLSEESAGTEADLWWAVRGAAPAFGVVTSVVLFVYTACRSQEKSAVDGARAATSAVALTSPRRWPTRSGGRRHRPAASTSNTRAVRCPTCRTPTPPSGVATASGTFR